jgi:hypothetical protein
MPSSPSPLTPSTLERDGEMTFAPSAPDIGAHDLDPLRIDLQRASQRGAGSIDDLGADIDQEVIPAWHGEACIRLHGLGEAIWRVVVLVDLNGSVSALRLEITHRAIGRQAEDTPLRATRWRSSQMAG